MSQQNLKQSYNALQSDFTSNRADPKKVTKLITDTELQLALLGGLTPTRRGEHEEASEVETIARQTFEISAFHALRTKSISLFTRAISQLSPFYSPFSGIPPSPSQGPLTCLYLLHLLSENRISNFHTQVETLSKELMENKFVQWVRDLERQLSAGAYARAYHEAREGIPDLRNNEGGWAKKEDFGWLVGQLIDGMRAEIASCAARAYPSRTLSLDDASTLLFFGKKERSALMEFGAKHSWQIDPSTGLITFPETDSPNESSVELQKEKMAEAALGYARELESIV